MKLSSGSSRQRGGAEQPGFFSALILGQLECNLQLHRKLEINP